MPTRGIISRCFRSRGRIVNVHRVIASIDAHVVTITVVIRTNRASVSITPSAVVALVIVIADICAEIASIRAGVVTTLMRIVTTTVRVATITPRVVVSDLESMWIMRNKCQWA